jgi:hypothetical protein
MEDEGIMALPGGAAMQQDGMQNVVSSADSYDAALTALGQVSPQDLMAYKEVLRQNLAELMLTPQQIEYMILMFEYVSENPKEYKNLVQMLLEEGAVDPGDMPDEYDPAFVGIILAVLNELRLQTVEGAAPPVVPGLPAMSPEPLRMAQGGLADVAQYMQSMGRGGDRLLAHITPEEAMMLKKAGGAGTINPNTGLLEFKGNPLKKVFKGVKSVFKSVVKAVKSVVKSPIGRILTTVALATVLGPAGVGLSMGTAAGLAGAGTTLMAGGSLKEALVSGAMGYFGGGGTIGGINPVSSIGSILPGAAGSALNTGLSTAAMGTLGGLATGQNLKESLKAGALGGITAAGIQAGGDFLTATQETPAPIDVRDVGSSSMPAGTMAAEAASADLGVMGGPGTGLRVGGIDAMSPLSTSSVMPQGSPTMGAISGAQAAPTAMGATGQGYFGGLEAPGMQPAAMGMGNVNYSLTQNPNLAPVGARAAGTAGTSSAASSSGGFFDRAGNFIKNPSLDNFSDVIFNPNARTMLGKYGPAAVTTLAATGMMGGYEPQPVDEQPLYNPNYTADDYIRDNPQLFPDRGFAAPDLTPTSPLVNSSRYFASPTLETTNPLVESGMGGMGGLPSIPISTTPVVFPGTGITATQPGQGIPQPYNLSGMYGVPLLYRKRGSGPSGENFPRRTGPINGPGTGTSDSIPAMLSDGEFVFTAKAVRNAGGGSRRKGAARMYKLMKGLESGGLVSKKKKEA